MAKRTKLPPVGTPEYNVALFRRYIECENARDYKNLEKLFDPKEFVCHTWFGHHPIRPQALTRMLKGLFCAFPDWYMTINEIICADTVSVAGRITGRGSQAEEFMNRPPSDQQIAIMLVHTITVRDGLIIEYRATNPFDDPFRADIVAPEDVQEARAQQGIDSERLNRLIQTTEVTEKKSVALTQLKEEYVSEQQRCQALLKSNMRRCQMPVAPGAIYCKHHVNHGYGIDGLE